MIQWSFIKSFLEEQGLDEDPSLFVDVASALAKTNNDFNTAWRVIGRHVRKAKAKVVKKGEGWVAYWMQVIKVERNSAMRPGLFASQQGLSKKPVFFSDLRQTFEALEKTKKERDKLLLAEQQLKPFIKRPPKAFHIELCYRFLKDLEKRKISFEAFFAIYEKMQLQLHQCGLLLASALSPRAKREALEQLVNQNPFLYPEEFKAETGDFEKKVKAFIGSHPLHEWMAMMQEISQIASLEEREEQTRLLVEASATVLNQKMQKANQEKEQWLRDHGMLRPDRLIAAFKKMSKIEAAKQQLVKILGIKETLKGEELIAVLEQKKQALEGEKEFVAYRVYLIDQLIEMIRKPSQEERTIQALIQKSIEVKSLLEKPCSDKKSYQARVEKLAHLEKKWTELQEKVKEGSRKRAFALFRRALTRRGDQIDKALLNKGHPRMRLQTLNQLKVEALGKGILNSIFKIRAMEHIILNTMVFALLIIQLYFMQQAWARLAISVGTIGLIGVTQLVSQVIENPLKRLQKKHKTHLLERGLFNPAVKRALETTEVSNHQPHLQRLKTLKIQYGLDAVERTQASLTPLASREHFSESMKQAGIKENIYEGPSVEKKPNEEEILGALHLIYNNLKKRVEKIERQDFPPIQLFQKLMAECKTDILASAIDASWKNRRKFEIWVLKMKSSFAHRMDAKLIPLLEEFMSELEALPLMQNGDVQPLVLKKRNEFVKGLIDPLFVSMKRYPIFDAKIEEMSTFLGNKGVRELLGEWVEWLNKHETSFPSEVQPLKAHLEETQETWLLGVKIDKLTQEILKGELTRERVSEITLVEKNPFLQDFLGQIKSLLPPYSLQALLVQLNEALQKLDKSQVSEQLRAQLILCKPFFQNINLKHIGEIKNKGSELRQYIGPLLEKIEETLIAHEKLKPQPLEVRKEQIQGIDQISRRLGALLQECQQERGLLALSREVEALAPIVRVEGTSSKKDIEKLKKCIAEALGREGLSKELRQLLAEFGANLKKPIERNEQAE